MKIRLVTAAALAGGLALSVSGAQAATPTIDGKKVTSLTLTANGGVQSNDAEQASLATTDRLACAAPRCAKLTFTYAPAKGLKNGDLRFTATWTNPASDIDLYVGELDKKGNASDIGHCGGTGGTSEKVFLPKSSLKAGHRYVMVLDFYRSLNETATGKVEIGVPNTIKSTVPASLDGQVPGTVFPVNCIL